VQVILVITVITVITVILEKPEGSCCNNLWLRARHPLLSRRRFSSAMLCAKTELIFIKVEHDRIARFHPAARHDLLQVQPNKATVPPSSGMVNFILRHDPAIVSFRLLEQART
jgi:hypothetical protein